MAAMAPSEASSGAAHRIHDQRTEADRRADKLLGADGGLSDQKASARLERYRRDGKMVLYTLTPRGQLLLGAIAAPDAELVG
jgi:hypothetical protein